MTKQQDKIAVDTASAAQLVKTTAEQTATALNIQYIQRDMAEMKLSLATLATSQDGKVEELAAKHEKDVIVVDQRIDTLSKTVNIGIGIAIAASTLMPFVYKILFK